MKSIAKFRGWIGESVSRRLAIPGLVLILLLLVQAALSTGSAFRLVGRLEESSTNSSASMKLTAPGTIEVECAIHPEMKMKIEVSK